MSEAGTATAGSILRDARQAQGLHIGALAASIKVSQKKLEALEADRFDELPDATFTRALAQTVCRSLKMDPAPVLALLPQPSSHRLEQVAEGINAPFRDRPGRREPKAWTTLASPAVWGPLLVLLAAALVYLMPQGWLASAPSFSSVAPAASAPATVSESMPPGSATEPVGTGAVAPSEAPPSAASAPPLAAPAANGAAPVANIAQASPAPAATSANAAVQLRAKAASWIEVQDANAQVLLSRRLKAGETVQLDGVLPMRVKIGNAAATELVFRGQPLDLAASTRDNVSRLELK